MHELAFLLHLSDFAVERLHVGTDRVELRVTAIRRQAACLVCHRPSARVHSRYERQVADLPWNCARVRLRAVARRFRCAVTACPRRIFCERLPSLVGIYARCTGLLTELLQAVGLALGGRPGRRLARRLHLSTSCSNYSPTLT
jgi:transposase